jgi:hypothetical protein
MHDINAIGSRHVALNAIVVFALRQASGSVKLASWFLVALETPSAEIGGLFFRGRELVRVVTRNAVKAAPAFAITATEFHLFNLPDCRVASILRAAVYGEKLRQWQPRTVVKCGAAESIDPVVSQQVALFADRHAQGRLQVPWIHDGQLSTVDKLLSSRVQFTGSVASLAADRVAAENRLFVAVGGVLNRLDSVRMTEQTARFDRAVKVWIGRIVTR